MFKFRKDGLLDTKQGRKREPDFLKSPTQPPIISQSPRVNNIYNNSSNTISYQIPNEATNAALGGDIGNALSELKGVFSTPFKSLFGNLFNKDLDADRNESLDNIEKETKKQTKILAQSESEKKRGRGKDKKQRKRRGYKPKSEEQKELETQTDLLDKISKNAGNKGGSNNFLNKKNPLSGLGKVMGAKGIIKGLGVFGAIAGALTGMAEYKDKFNITGGTTFSQKIVAGIGGVLSGINDVVSFFTGGTVELINKDRMWKKLEQIRVLAVSSLDSLLADHPTLKTIVNKIGTTLNNIGDTAGDILNEVYTSLATETISLPTLSKMIENIKFEADYLYESMLDVRDSITDSISGWITKSKQALGIRTKTEKEFELARDKRQAIQDEIKGGKGLFESYEDYKKRMKALNAELIKAKEDEVAAAKKALKDKAFADESDLRFSAKQALLIKEQEEYIKGSKKAKEWTIEKNRLQNLLDNDLKMIDKITNMLRHETNPKKIKMLQTQLEAYGLAYQNTIEDLKRLGKRPNSPSLNASLSGIAHGGIKTGEAKLLQTIRRGEGTTYAQAKKHGYSSGYDVTLGNGKFADDKSKPITQMTIKEVYALQKRMKKNKKNRFATGRRDKHGRMIKLPSSAVGAYQLIEPTLKRLVKKLGIDENTKFDSALQDRLGLELVREAGGDRYRKGRISDSKFQNNLANTWASIATTRGKSAYGQHTGTSGKRIRDAMHSYRDEKPKKSQKVQKKTAVSSKKVDNGNRDLLAQLVKNTTPKQKSEAIKKGEVNNQPPIVVNHHEQHPTI
jgi:muramidase (phage lysozyme)